MVCDALQLNRPPYTVNVGDRVAQFLVQQVRQDVIVEVETLTETERGENGFSSTGL